MAFKGLALMVVLLAANTCQAASLPTEWERLFLETANASVVIDVEAIHASPIAVSQGWRQRLTQGYIEKAIWLPPDASKMMMVSHLDLQANLNPVWKVTAIQLKRQPDLLSIARQMGGEMDMVSGHNALHTSQGRLVPELESDSLLVLAPGDRQAAGRLLRKYDEPVAASPTHSVAKILKKTDSAAPFVLTLDLTDAISPATAQQIVKESEVIQSASLNQAQAAEVLSAIQSVTLSLSFTDTTQARLTIEFDGPVEPIQTVAKPLVIERLQEFGVAVDTLDKWQLESSASSLTLTGPLSDSGLRRAFSLLEVPKIPLSEPQEQSTKDNSQDAVVKASMAYFKNLQTLLDDLRKELNKSQHYHTVWLERYGRKIDDLPILNVDKNLLDFASTVSSSLRNQANARRSASAASERVIAADAYNKAYYGSYANQATAPAYLTRQAYSAERFRSWRSIDDGIAAIRRYLTETYKVEF